MLKLTKTGIGLLTKQYRSVLKKCLLLNLGIFALTATNIIIQQNAYALTEGNASGDRSVAIGYNSASPGATSVAVGNSALSEGYDSVALGDYAHAFSFKSTALGNDAFVYGELSVAVGNQAKVGDSSNEISGAVALGFASNATVENTVSVGHLASDLNYLGATYGSDLFRRIVNVAAGQNDHDVVILKQLNDALNYYYTFRVDERTEVTDSASFFQKDFSTLQEVDLQSKNPTHLGAFTKCDEVCPRPSERFSLSLSQEQMLKNDASVDAGTSRHCLRQFGDVVADLLKNTAAKSLRIYEFMNEEVCHA